MALPVERGPAVQGAPPRIINVILGVCLFISAFVWPHTQAQMTNTWICGVLVVIFALIGMAVPWVRYLNTLLAIWLFISAWALPTANVGTVWNNVLVPSHALGVRMGASMRVNSRESKKSRTALMMVWRTRMTACWRLLRSQRWRWSIKKSVPCSLGPMGYSRATGAMFRKSVVSSS